MKTFLLALALGGSALAGELAVLTTGYRLHADRHEIDGATVRLFHKGGGSSEIPASLVAAFEEEIALPAAAAVVAEEPVVKPAAAPADPRELVEAAALKHGLPARVVHSVVSADSGYRPGAVSPKGAIGLMQLMPATAQAFGADPHDPAQNVEAGTAYLRELLIKYNGNSALALAAYNAGPGAVDRYNGVPPYAETRTYIERVLRKYSQAK